MLDKENQVPVEQVVKDKSMANKSYNGISPMTEKHQYIDQSPEDVIESDDESRPASPMQTTMSN